MSRKITAHTFTKLQHIRSPSQTGAGWSWPEAERGLRKPWVTQGGLDSWWMSCGKCIRSQNCKYGLEIAVHMVAKLRCIRLQNYGRTSFAQLAPNVADALLDNFKWRFQSRQKSRKEAFPLFEPVFEIWASRQSGSSKLAKKGFEPLD